jgi:ligand-binding sensor domain-containing protein
MESNMTQKQRLASAFSNGAELTSKQIRSQFKIASPTKVVSLLRMEDGLPIYANKHVDGSGRETTKFRLGTPSRKVIAAGYRAMAMGVV